MTPVVFIGVVVGLMLAGLAIMWLSKQQPGTLGVVFWWAGVVIAVTGLILFVARVAVYLGEHLKAMIGA